MAIFRCPSPSRRLVPLAIEQSVSTHLLLGRTLWIVCYARLCLDISSVSRSRHTLAARPVNNNIPHGPSISPYSQISHPSHRFKLATELCTWVNAQRSGFFCISVLFHRGCIRMKTLYWILRRSGVPKKHQVSCTSA
jgi:hypothetical protein